MPVYQVLRKCTTNRAQIGDKVEVQAGSKAEAETRAEAKPLKMLLDTEEVIDGPHALSVRKMTESAESRSQS